VRVEQIEHGGRVGRGDDRADEQPLQGMQVEQGNGRDAGDARGHQHADGRQDRGGLQSKTKRLVRGPQTAVEQDHGQGQAGEGECQIDVVEHDPAGAVLAEQHAHDEEHQQQRRPDTIGDPARQHAD